jgi:LysM repeat protein
MIHVTWEDAQLYCSWVDRRLPTEAEWEKAASWDTMNQTKYVYPWGNNSPNNSLLNYGRKVGDTTEVGRYPDGASPYGALDMAGNVAEWVADWYSDTYYAGSPLSNPLGPAAGQYRVRRGGSYSDYNHSSTLRLSYYNPTDSSNEVGFRCAVSAANQVGASETVPSATFVPADLPSGTLIEYRILPGDTLTWIAIKFNSLEGEIIEINNIENPNTLVVGQVLQIPVNLVTATATLPSTSTPVRPTQTATLPPTSTPVLPTPTATP